MRLIDADALSNKLIEIGNRTGESEFITQTLLWHLDRAPTESRWIPVTQDIPTEDDDYWATFEAETGRFVDWASWYQGRWVTWIEGSPAPLSNVIAWCKPMEPYKG